MFTLQGLFKTIKVGKLDRFTFHFNLFIISYRPESYHAHEGYLYCHMHFKLIFAPKIVYEEVKPRKPELIIRENQPMELPPDVARGKIVTYKTNLLRS